MIIGLHGPAGSGKSYIADLLVRERGFERLSFAAALRDAAEIINPIVNEYGDRYQNVVSRFGYDDAKQHFPEVRQFLERLGTDVMRNRFGMPDFWLNQIAHHDAFNRAHRGEGRVVIDDVRFPNEANLIASAAGFVLQINSPFSHDLRGHHVSRQQLPSLLLDGQVYNSQDVAHNNDLLKQFDAFFEKQGLTP